MPMSPGGAVHASRRLALIVAIVAMLAHSAYLQPWTLDDAYISMHYAENFARGEGLVFNPGERVEGYTNFLWVLLLGVARVAGLPTVATAKVLGTVCAVGCLLATAWAHRAHAGFTPRASVTATLLLGTLGIFTVWVMSGMEVALSALTVLGAVLLHLRSRDGRTPVVGAAAGACCALAAMAHPELGLTFPVLLVDRVRRGPRSWGPFVAAFAGLYGPYFAWRWAYYGWLLPNTFYNKVGGTWEQVQRGFHYLGEFVWPALLLLTAIIAGALSRRVRLSRVVLAYVAVHTVFVVLVGGDVMPAFRFLSPVAPLLCLLAATAVDRLVPPRRMAAVVAVMIAFSVTQAFVNHDLHGRVIHGRIGHNGCELGTWLGEHAPPGAVIATNNVGGVAYCSGLNAIDMLGLTDEHIAHVDVPMGRGPAGHEKHDGHYVLDRAPDYIQLGSSRGARRPKFPGDKEIWRDPRFAEHYELVKIQLPSGGTVYLYQRVD